MASPTITFRLSEMRDKQIRDYVDRIKIIRPWWGEYTLTDFVKQAIEEKLAHLDRSRKASAKRAKRYAEMKIPSPLPVVDNETQLGSDEFETAWGVVS